MANPFNCPDSVYAALRNPFAPDLLRAVKKLGPKLVQWNPKKPYKNVAQKSDFKTETHWSFVGQSNHATVGDILSLARSEGLIGRGSCHS